MPGSASLGPEHPVSTPAQVDAALARAAEAAISFARQGGRVRGALLRRIAANIESGAEAIVERAGLETALPEARLRGELARTCGQLRLFAEMAEEGSWVDARIDLPDPHRAPMPKPDLRSMRRPLGPIAIFGASNFPLAFSVAGGDTASALAAGNPVVVKAHPAHPGTSALVGAAVGKAVDDAGLGAGTFAVLFDEGIELGLALVRDPRIKGVGFTGSRRAGRALMDEAAARREPVPVFAEMSSVNPVFVLAAALAARGPQIAAGLHASFTAGVGQFCTSPGIVFVESGAAGDAFVSRLAALAAATPAAPMLTPGIASAYRAGAEHLRAAGAREVAHGASGDGELGVAAVFEVDAEELLASPSLAEEVFGPSTLVARYAAAAVPLAFARTMEGNLTATLHAEESDLAAAGELIAALEGRVGRLILNGFPTGVEVCHAMVHGGPYPATSDGASTSVGTHAIERFTRLLCYQDFPDTALPKELQDANPLAILRMVDGRWVREAIATTTH
ncbi:aldehyde dehydrogenase (NADP(+)) [bacterium]|nr:MAG: aldehyde dehydrogenase (NADP(+)) [bacterium]